jgi:hypothetical protein
MTLYTAPLNNRRYFECRQPFKIAGNVPVTVSTNGQQTNWEKSERSGDLTYNTTCNVSINVTSKGAGVTFVVVETAISFTYFVCVSLFLCVFVCVCVCARARVCSLGFPA